MRSIEVRRTYSDDRLKELALALQRRDPPIGTEGCVYVTGSYARGEATQHSDLDLFVVGNSDLHEGHEVRRLTRLDEICLLSDLVRTNKDLGIEPFSGDGEYLQHYTIHQLIDTLGSPRDDADNTFTARLLLLLESRCLLGIDTYRLAIDRVIDAYWRDFPKHAHEFEPAFLVNDILRLWRTFCVNYEARTKNDPPRARAKRKLRNYKLRHSRLLTCFSALAFLLREFSAQKTVTKQAALRMVELSPTQRIESIANEGQPPTTVAELATAILNHYDDFLTAMDKSTDDLITVFLSDEDRGKLPRSHALGDTMAQLLGAIGDGTCMLRHLLV